MEIEFKTSGTKTWGKVTGTFAELKRISRITRTPIKKAAGKNIEHIDVSGKMLKRICA